MKQTVIGQTGRCVLSDNQVNRKLSRARTVRYQYQRVKHGWLCWVCAPFHSRTYGACGFGAQSEHTSNGTAKARAKAALQRNLARSYRYFGNLMFSAVDESDNVGDVNPRLLDDHTLNRPIWADQRAREECSYGT